MVHNNPREMMRAKMSKRIQELSRKYPYVKNRQITCGQMSLSCFVHG